MKTKFLFSAAAICRVLTAFALGISQNANSSPALLAGAAMNQVSQDDEHLIEEESWIRLPLEVSVSDFAAALNALVPKRFQVHENRDVTRALVEDYVECTVDRGNISLQAQHGHLGFTIPVSGTVTVGGQFNPLHGIGIGRGKHAQQSAHVTGTLSGTLDMHLNPDWSISPDVTLDIEFDQAEVRLFNSIPISIKRVLDEAFQRNSTAIKNQIAAQLHSRAQLRENATHAWQSLHVAKQIVISPPIWATVRPLEVVASDISVSDDGRMLGGFAVRCAVAGTLGDPPVLEPPSPLPELRIKTQIPTDSHVHFPLRADLDSIAAMLNERFSAAAIKIGDRKAYLREIKLTVVGKKIRLEGLLKIEGENLPQSLQTRVALEGTPGIDPESETIQIPDLTLSFLDEDAVSALASVFLEPMTAELRRQARYNYKGDLERLRGSVSALSPQLGVDEHLSLSVSIEDIRIGDLKLLPDSISVLGLITGKARLLAH